MRIDPPPRARSVRGRLAGRRRGSSAAPDRAGSCAGSPIPSAARDCYRAALPDALLLAAGVRRRRPHHGAAGGQPARSRDGAVPDVAAPAPEGGLGAVRVEVRGRRGAGGRCRCSAPWTGRPWPQARWPRRRRSRPVRRAAASRAPAGPGGDGRAGAVPRRARSARRESRGVRRRRGRLKWFRPSGVAVAAPARRSRHSLASPIAVGVVGPTAGGATAWCWVRRRRRTAPRCRPAASGAPRCAAGRCGTRSRRADWASSSELRPSRK